MERKPNTIRALLDVYAAKKLRRKERSTFNKYTYAIDHWSDLIGEEPVLANLNDEAVGEFQDYLVEIVGLAEDTALTYTKKLLALWRFAHRQRWAWRWPAVELIEPPDVIPIAWSRQQLAVLFKALRTQAGFIGCVPAGPWWVAFHWVFWCSSERLSAVLSLRWETVDLDGAFVVFPAKSRKGKRKPTSYPLSVQCVKALRAIQEPRREFVFPFPYDRSTIFKRYKRILHGAGLPNDRKHMFHCMRKSVASWMEAAGVDSTDTLGHSDRRVTRRHYLDPRIVRPPSPSSVLFDPEGDGPRAA